MTPDTNLPTATRDLIEDAKTCLMAMYDGHPVHGGSTLAINLLLSVRKFEPDFNPVPLPSRGVRP